MGSTRIGTAGWSIGREAADRFPPVGSSLERYSAVFDAVEINSSFHRPHRVSTWERWRDSVPAGFHFSVKVPKRITHELKLADHEEALATFLAEVGALGEKLAVLLVQLPPKLALDPQVARAFFTDLAVRSHAAIACEPRHQSWFTDEADALLAGLRVARVAADPARHPGAGEPGGWSGLAYWRLHGSPVMYRSSYHDRIAAYASTIDEAARTGSAAWCIFDNTASSAAMGDALELKDASGA
ncbi:hypothetical protein GCM10011515_09580 [Tsuneonella deserti]|uniref:DUF72 domain-containing protein n=1 Tax=Tsuneonella deserti TaxID=2035528 RepID=A0ABQ1S654_9SPHN|nr:DUF72 domain-containing protein [Tsuneonella deserti]GGD91955.1 hypothetical protein GCM10011515_09580 [Tsuneonella deserti]